ncbi:MAG: outer rane transport energization protein TonB [Bacteroidetes bacterium]|nr:outer rane transport energization protein TonB [Bacteroidota bacterium]
MSKIDLTSSEWCNLVFEGKNKNFGAYVMRQSSPSRHRKAMIIITIIAIIAFSVPTLIKIITPKKDDVKITEVTALSKLPPAEKKDDNVVKKLDTPPPALKSSIKFTAPVIKKDSEVSEEDEIKSQDELIKNTAAISIADIKGTDELNGKDIADIQAISNEPSKEEPEKVFTYVEQPPAFPGGEAELAKYLKENIKYPQEAREVGIQGKVYVSFIVGRDGNITDIKVIRPLHYACDKEALRVVKTMPRWTPGKQNGNNVTVQFTLPISFQLR